MKGLPPQCALRGSYGYEFMVFKKSSLLKITFAALVISMYTYVFGIIEVVEGGKRLTENPTANTEATTSPVVPVEPSETGDMSDKPLINVINGRLPVLADGEMPVIPQVATQAPESVSGDATEAPVAAEEPMGTVKQPTGDNIIPGNSDGSGQSGEKPVSGEKLQVASNTDGGKVIEGDAFDIVTRVVQGEIGSSFHKEAIKAQGVAAYTYIKKQNAAGLTPSLPMSNVASQRVKECVQEVWGQHIYFNGEIAQSVFHASSAGWTCSASNVWGEDIPYLRSVQCDFDAEYDPNTEKIVTFSSNDIMANVLKETGIELKGDPANWLQIINHVDNAYVGSMSIGGQTTYTKSGKTENITGRIFRERIMDRALRSASFTFSYNSVTDRFTFTTKGYGHGAGMSQNGANILATYHGFSYVDIIQHYYIGVTVE